MADNSYSNFIGKEEERYCSRERTMNAAGAKNIQCCQVQTDDIKTFENIDISRYLDISSGFK